MNLQKSQLKKVIKNLSFKEINILYKTPDLFLLPHQKPPTDNKWRYWLMMGGRGGGKSWALMAWLYQQYLNGAKSLGICGADYNSVINDLVPVFLSWFKAEPEQPKYNSQKGIIQLPNDATVYIYTSQTEVRGPNLEALACDELVKWCDGIEEKQVERFQVLDFAVRKGSNPRIVIASTPRPLMWFLNYVNQVEKGNELYRLTKATTYDNPHLSKQFLKAIESTYEGSRIGAQEIYAELLSDVPGALWNLDIINQNRLKSFKEFEALFEDPDFYITRTVTAVDPSVSDSNKSDETGIVTAHLCSDGEVYIVSDASGQMSPNQWVNKAITEYHNNESDTIVAEKNQGDLLITKAFNSVDSRVPIKLVHAKRGKMVRAEPVSSLYFQGYVHHVGYFPGLEREMTTFCGDPKQKSPGRMDALVYAVTELLLEKAPIQPDYDNIGFYG